MISYRVDHIHLKANDVEQAAQWYCEKLNGKIILEGQFRESKVFYVNIKGFNIVIFGRLEGEDDPIPASLSTRFGVDHFGFEVDDIHQAVDDLKSKSVKILEEPWSPRDGQYIAYFEGPDQVRLELTQRDWQL